MASSKALLEQEKQSAIALLEETLKRIKRGLLVPYSSGIWTSGTEGSVHLQINFKDAEESRKFEQNRSKTA